MRHILIIGLIVLSACDSISSEAKVQTAIAQTQNAAPLITPSQTLAPIPTPTFTLTPVLLSELEIEPLLIQQGDLPAGFSGAQVSKFPPEMFNNLPEAENEIYQQFEKGGEPAGGVAVFLYGSEDKLELAYNTLVEGFTEDKIIINDVGEKAEYDYLYFDMLGVITENSDLSFIRCNALVHIRMSNEEQRPILSYAQRLDERLTQVICR